MRSLIVICLLVGAASAGDDIPSPRPMQRVSLGIGVIGQGGKLGGLDLRAWGPNVELAIGSRRWQYFGEAGYQFATLGEDIAGRQLRGGLGVRYHARAFELGDRGSIDMYFEAFAGWSRYAFDERAAIDRPDLGAGVGYGVRTFFGRDRGIRISARVYFAPTDRRDEAIACRGTCPMTGSSNSGLMAVFGGYL